MCVTDSDSRPRAVMVMAWSPGTQRIARQSPIERSLRVPESSSIRSTDKVTFVVTRKPEGSTNRIADCGVGLRGTWTIRVNGTGLGCQQFCGRVQGRDRVDVILCQAVLALLGLHDIARFYRKGKDQRMPVSCSAMCEQVTLATIFPFFILSKVHVAGDRLAR